MKRKTRHSLKQARFICSYSPWECIHLPHTHTHTHTHTYTQTSHTYSLTYELDSLQEPAADVFFVVVLHRDTFVLVHPLEVVWTVGRHVQQGGDSYGVQNLLL